MYLITLISARSDEMDMRDWTIVNKVDKRD